MPRAYDLVAGVSSPAEVFPRLEALERMSMTLAFAGHGDAAAETAEFLEEARRFEALTEQRLARLRGVWRAVEMSGRPDVPVAERAARVAAAADEYRAQGPAS
ncbi:hypothetical protein [Pseudarthrobacter sp. BIM B-2242]|uniref:hypothetical protein n=1 Tax=Pseudarthrobacter sp. BIM B-2242 TaxID=2772401 RepID=UPI00168A58C7|nr:hypothetical protein [Pseudarthrobacter sp. BIM B-2242]QOD05691.1 hypothetical protein IDT60_21855 [Pseudarthrobacter sp. BIM B-2242]